MTSLRTHWATGPLQPLAIPAPIPLPATPGFERLMGLIMQDNPADGDAVIKAAAEYAAEDFAIRLDSIMEQQGLRLAPPFPRLQQYLQKPWADNSGFSWQEYGLKFPRWYEDDWNDFAKLRDRAKNGDFDSQDGGLIRTQVVMYERLHNL